MQLYRKLKAVTAWSVNSLIREVRITEAKKLLKNPEMNISEIAYQLGFSYPKYFSSISKKRWELRRYNIGKSIVTKSRERW